VNFCFGRASRPILAAGAFALLASFVSGPLAQAQDASQPAAGAQPQKNYKDRGEYDLYSKITQTTDPKARLELLNTWTDKYPQTDFTAERLQYYMVTLAALAATDPTQRQPLLNKCQDLLKLDPQNFRAQYLICVWGPAVGGASPAPELLSQVEAAAHGVISGADTTFDPSKKPASVSADQFTQAKTQSVALAHNSLAWAATAKKDSATAESEYKASLQANPDQGNVSASYAKLLYDEKKFPEALFEYARAAEYTGPGPALPPATRTQLTDFFNKAYKDFHGGTDGADQVLAQAKTAALPPGGFAIGSAADAANKEADAMKQRIASDPGFGLWYTIRQNLTGDQGDTFFSNTVKDAEIPGGAQGVQNFSGTVISIDPPDKPTKVVLGVDDPTKGDATLEFSQPLPASALDKIKVGQKLDFSGVADSYTKDPYMLTFKDPTIPGVQTAAPAKKGTHKHR